MSGGGGGPIIIWTLTFSQPSYLPEKTVIRLREIALHANETGHMSLTDRLFVAWASFLYLGRSAPDYRQ